MKFSIVLSLALAITLCTQSVFAYVSIISGVISNGYAVIDYISKHMPGDENKVLQYHSYESNGNTCDIFVHKLKGKNIYVKYHVDKGTPHDIIQAAANNGHTYKVMMRTLTDKMKSEKHGGWHLEVASVNERVITRSLGCADGRTKWTGKAAEYDYHIALSKDYGCWKNFRELKESSQRISKEVTDHNNKYNPC